MVQAGLRNASVASATATARCQFRDSPPTMFICGNDEPAKTMVSGLIQSVGWAVADMGTAVAARAIEPLCMLWCIPGIVRGEWAHAFKLVKPL